MTSRKLAERHEGRNGMNGMSTLSRAAMMMAMDDNWRCMCWPEMLRGGWGQAQQENFTCWRRNPAAGRATREGRIYVALYMGLYVGGKKYLIGKLC